MRCAVSFTVAGCTPHARRTEGKDRPPGAIREPPASDCLTKVENMKTALLLSFFLVLNANAQTLRDGLVAWFPFDGNVEDVHRGHHLIASSDLNAPVYEAGRVGDALKASQVVHEGREFRFEGSFTWSFWMRMPSTAGTSAYFPFATTLNGQLATANSYKLAWWHGDPGRLSWQVMVDGVNVLQKGDQLNPVEPDGSWHHVVLWRDVETGVIGIAVDGGSPRTTVAPTGPIGFTGTESVVVGRSGFIGSLDEMAAWSRVLTDAERRELAAGISYADTESGASGPSPTSPTAEMVCSRNTGNSASVLFGSGAIAELVEGDRVLAYDPNTGCVGQSVFNGGNFSLPVWGDDTVTPEKDGMAAGDPFQILVQRTSVPTVSTEYQATLNYSANGVYSLDALNVNMGSSDATLLARIEELEAKVDSLTAEKLQLENNLAVTNDKLTRIQAITNE